MILMIRNESVFITQNGLRIESVLCPGDPQSFMV
jgi:hypothetical protein